MNTDFEAAQEMFWSCFEPLQNFEFSFYNPLLWIILVALFLVLTKIWNSKKSFYFCLMLTFILLATTEIESRAAELFSIPGQSLETSLIKFISLALITIIFLSYAFTS